MAYRLMAADYDLTLTGSDRKVSAHTRETIRAVYAAGKFVTLASGRLGGSAEVARELFPGDVPLILGNGGLVQSCATGETLSETLMDEPTALTMLRWCRRRASAAIVYGRSGIYTDRVNAASEMYAQRSSSTPLPLPSPEEIAAEMDMPVDKVREILKIAQEPVSLETPIGEEEDSHLGDFIQDDNVPVPAEAAAFTLLREQLDEVLGTLTDREQKVLKLRFGLEDGRARTLEEVGKEFKVTRERIRQIEAKALRKLRHPSRSRKLKDYLE